jgi:DNA-binding CsgD family transcriptional regulator
VTLRLYDLDRATTFQQEALAALPALGDAIWVRLMETSIFGHLGNIAVALGDVDRADVLFTAALNRQRALGYEFGTSHIAASHPIAGLGDVARARGDHALALSWYQDALGHAWSFRDARAVAYALGGTAGTLAAAGRWEEAARLFGASEALHERAGLHFDLETMNRQRALGLPEPWQRAGEPFDSGQPLREAIKNRGTVVAPVVPDPELAAQAWEDGRSIPLVEAITKAISAAIPAIPPADSVFGLTPREREVLTLLTEGRSNQAIADTLFISPRTAKNHVAHILAKLGANSRAAAVAYALRHGLA